MQKSRWIILILLVGLSWSCTKSPAGGSLYTPTSADVTANATLTELQQGRILYSDNCSRCHNLYSPDDYSVSSWKSILSVMAPRTGMNSSQITLVTKYVCRGNQ